MWEFDERLFHSWFSVCTLFWKMTWITARPTNAAKLRDDLAKWVANGRRTGGRKSLAPATASRGGGSGRSKADLAKIRAWARDNGHQVSDRGRISASVQDAYDQANA